MIKKYIVTLSLLLALLPAASMDLRTHISLKQPGNPSVRYELTANGNSLRATNGTALPVELTLTQTERGGESVLTLTLKAKSRIYYNVGFDLPTQSATDNCDFYLPGFWYHKNMRSPEKAPSFKTSSSWNVREDRLSSPLTGVYDQTTKQGLVVMRHLDKAEDALTTHKEGEVILSGRTSVGYLGFDNASGTASLTFGYPYVETPKRYTSKLTLTPAIYAFSKLEAGETKTISWTVKKEEATDFGDFVGKTWAYCFQTLNPQVVNAHVDGEQVKKQLLPYFYNAYVDRYELKYNSGLSLKITDCEPQKVLELGFCGRALLNAFNELEYGEKHNDDLLAQRGRAIFQSFLEHGFTPAGYLYEYKDYGQAKPGDIIHSIRRESEAVYAILHMLNYDRRNGVRHKDWEQKVRGLVDNLLKIQNPDGSFPRKFDEQGKAVDASGGSTPSATGPLVMAYKYFGDKRYLNAAKRTVDYLRDNIILKSDYFSSTLDANCEDKEAAISAVTATYYMALVSKGKTRNYYIDLCNKATRFALSWYYLWDVPFAEGQMLGDLGFKTRGWGNVSVENNHVDVFVFEFPHILKWLGEQLHEPSYGRMYDVIYSSLSQLMPTEGRLCGIAKPGFYPEVVQHTAWDYGRNGKGFYNLYFAPGWTVASLWELYTPNRTTSFFQK